MYTARLDRKAMLNGNEIIYVRFEVSVAMLEALKDQLEKNSTRAVRLDKLEWQVRPGMRTEVRLVLP
jgi:hypothetical protein